MLSASDMMYVPSLTAAREYVFIIVIFLSDVWPEKSLQPGVAEYYSAAAGGCQVSKTLQWSLSEPAWRSSEDLIGLAQGKEF